MEFLNIKRNAFPNLGLMVIVFSILFLTSCGRDELLPEITSGEFPFRFVYEVDGTIFEHEDVILCRFTGLDVSNAFDIWNRRTWRCELEDGGTRIWLWRGEDVYSVLDIERFNEHAHLSFFFGNAGGYFMGDPRNSDGGPDLLYVERYLRDVNVTAIVSTALTKEQVELYFGITVIELWVAPPIQNTFE